MIKILAVFTWALIALPSLAHAENATYLRSTATAKVGALEVRMDDLQVEPEAGYTFIILDLFPYRGKLKTKSSAKDLKQMARDLVLGPGLAAQPAMKAFRVALVEYSQRDDYGAPVLTSIKPLASFEGSVDVKGELKFKAKKGK